MVTLDKESAKILVVEDSRTQAEYLEHMLTGEGYRVDLAFNGSQALERIRTSRPAIVLTDIVMPEMDGYALCSAIKQDKDTADIPVILVTQLFDPPDLIKGLEAGANDIIIKPYKPEHVLTRVSGTLQALNRKKTDGTGPGLEVSYDGKTHLIPESGQTPAILLSSYDAAIKKNAELQEAYDQLTAVNEALEQKVGALRLAGENYPSAAATKPAGRSIGDLTISQDQGAPSYSRENLAQEDRFRMITELSPFPISIIDSMGKYQYVNRKFEQLFGYTLADLPATESWIPKGCIRSAGPQVTTVSGTPDPAYPEWGGATPQTFPVTCKSGAVRQIHFCPITLDSGGQFVVYEDLTDRTESERLRSILVSIVNSSNDAIIGKKLDGTILSWNKAAERYYGYLAEEVIGKSVEIIIPPELHDHLVVFLRRVGSGETIERFDTQRVRKDGSRIRVSVTLSPIKDDEGRIVGISTIAQNIADREKSEVNRMFREQVLHRR